MSVLYVSYDGVTEPIGRSQVLAYLVRLRARGYPITLLSFEKRSASREDRERCAGELRAAGIRWVPLRYHKRPTVPATAFDIAAGVAAGIGARRAGPIRLVHARSYVAGTIGLALKRTLGARLLFDTRNFWVDEKVDAGRWRRGGVLWRIAKRVERRLLSEADHVITLTRRARDELRRFEYLRMTPPPVTVIASSVDLALFKRASGAPPADPTSPALVYVGSVGGRYQDAVVGRFFGAVRRRARGATLEVWTRQDAASIARAAVAAGAPTACTAIRRGDPRDVAEALSRAHAGICFLGDGYSNRSSMPTKVAEYLASGLAVVSSPGVGDLDPLLADARAGVVPSGTSDEDLTAAAGRLLDLLADPGLPLRARSVAEREFSLDLAVERYDGVYRTLLDGAAP